MTNKNTLDNALSAIDIGRGYGQLDRRTKELKSQAKRLASQVNNFFDALESQERAINREGSIDAKEKKELLDGIYKARDELRNTLDAFVLR